MKSFKIEMDIQIILEANIESESLKFLSIDDGTALAATKIYSKKKRKRTEPFNIWLDKKG